MASELVIAYEAVYGSTFAADATSQSFEALVSSSFSPASTGSTGHGIPKQWRELVDRTVAGNPAVENYRLAVVAALKTTLGDSGAKAILFYIGEPSPDTFETKLRSILGEGAQMILVELKRSSEKFPGPPKHHWFSGRV